MKTTKIRSLLGFGFSKFTVALGAFGDVGHDGGRSAERSRAWDDDIDGAAPTQRRPFRENGK